MNPLADALNALDIHPEDAPIFERIAKRFERADPDTGCIFLSGGSFPDSRPKVMVSGRRMTAARAIAAVAHNRDSWSSLWEARHTCGNAACVAPDHLVPGCPIDNAADRDAHGRTARGERNGNSKLTDVQRQVIASDNRPNTMIAADYGVSARTIQYIKSGAR